MKTLCQEYGERSSNFRIWSWKSYENWFPGKCRKPVYLQYWHLSCCNFDISHITVHFFFFTWIIWIPWIFLSSIKTRMPHKTKHSGNQNSSCTFIQEIPDKLIHSQIWKLDNWLVDVASQFKVEQNFFFLIVKAFSVKIRRELPLLAIVLFESHY